MLAQEEPVLRHGFSDLRWYIEVVDNVRVFESRLFHFHPDSLYSLWKLKMYASAKQSKLEEHSTFTVELCRVFGSGSYHFKMFVCDNKETFTDIIFHSKDTSHTLDFSYIPCTQFTIHLELQERDKSNAANHSAPLSQLFKHLWTAGTYSDLALICQDRIFPVHTFILAHRAPLFLQHVYVPGKKQIDILHMLPNTLLVLLEWIYTGKIGEFFNKWFKLDQTYSVLAEQHLEILDMIKLYYLGPIFLTEVTEGLLCIHRTFYINFRYFIMLRYYHRTISHMYENSFQFLTLADHNLLLQSLVLKSSTSVEVTIRHLNIETDVHIYLKFCNGWRRRRLVFTKDKCSVRLQIDCDEYNHTWYLSTSRGRREFYSLPVERNCSTCFKDAYSHVQWYDSIQSLPKNSGDVLLVFGNGNSLTMWKALLAMHSPVFERMFVEGSFIESKTHRVDLTDFDVSIGHGLLEYLTSLRVDSTSFEIDAQLYIFAHKYMIGDLFQKCSHILRDHLRDNSQSSNMTQFTRMCNDTMAMADVFGDHDLKQEAEFFLR